MIHKSYLEQDAVCSHRPYRITEARMTCVGFAYSLELFKFHEFPRLFPRTCPVFHDLTFSCQLSKIFKTQTKRKNKTVFPDFSRLTIKFSDWLSRPDDEILIFHYWDTEIFYNSYELCLRNSVNYLLSLVFLLYVNNLPHGWETLNVGSWTELKSLESNEFLIKKLRYGGMST